jgi:hypothetical protein
MATYQEAAIWEKLQELENFHWIIPGARAKASCPAHGDRNPSLSIGTRDNGQVIFFCHASCEYRDIMAALGATWRDQWPNGTPAGEKRYEAKDRNGVTKDTHRRFYDPESGEKIMPWVKGTPTATLPLYGSEKVVGLPAGRIYLTEGEAACEALWKRGIAAVATMTGASGMPCDDSLRVLRKHVVILWPDNDDVGRAHMDRNAERLKALGSECGLLVWPDAPYKGDAEDYFAHGGTVEGLEALIQPYERNEIDERRKTEPAFSSSESLVPYPVLHPDALYSVAGSVVQLIEPHTESDPVAILSQFLTVMGNIFGRRAHYRVENDRHHPNLFITLVGPSSTARKGTSWGQSTRPLEGVEDDWLANNITSGLSSGEGLIHTLRDIEGEPNRDKRLLIRQGEFASVLKMTARDGNTLSDVLRDAWDGVPLRTLTKQQPEVASGTHVSIIGHITQGELLRYLTATESGNGFGNRFLWLCVKRSRKLALGGDLDSVSFNEAKSRIRTAIALSTTYDRRRVNFDAEAVKLWVPEYEDHLSEGPSGLLGSMTSRAEAQVIRLALLYAMLDCSVVITVDHLKAALAVWNYAMDSARFIFGDALGDPMADTILSELRAAPNGLTRTQISAVFGRNRSAGEIANALKVLHKQQLAICGHEETDGRSIERWIATSTKQTNLTKEGQLDEAA